MRSTAEEFKVDPDAYTLSILSRNTPNGGSDPKAIAD
jgi:hypothetical protein